MSYIFVVIIDDARDFANNCEHHEHLQSNVTLHIVSENPTSGRLSLRLFASVIALYLDSVTVN